MHNSNIEVIGFRLWADGTMQHADEGDTYTHMSDGFMLVSNSTKIGDIISFVGLAQAKLVFCQYLGV